MYIITVTNSNAAVIAGAYVTLDTTGSVYRATTNNSGVCIFDTEDAGDLTVSYYGYNTYTAAITIASPTISVTLPVLAGSVVCGRVTDENNLPAFDVDIVSTTVQNEYQFTTATDINGYWIFNTYRRYIQVSLGGDTVDIARSNDGVNTLYICNICHFSNDTYNIMGLITGLVIDANNNPVNMCKIYTETGAETYTDSTGRYYMLVDRGTYTVSASSPSIVTDSVTDVNVLVNNATILNFNTIVEVGEGGGAPTSTGVLSGYVLNASLPNEDIHFLALRFNNCSAKNIYVWVENPVVDIFSGTNLLYDKHINDYGIDVFGRVFPKSTTIADITTDDLPDSIVVTRSNTNKGLRVPDVTATVGEYEDSDIIAIQVRSRGVPVDDADYKGLQLMVAFDTVDIFE